MSKFCGTCGTALPDDAQVCSNCGTPCEILNNMTPKPAFDFDAILNKFVSFFTDPKMRKPLILIGSGVVALILVLVILFAVIVPNTGYKGAAKKVFKAFKNEDATALIDMSCIAADSELFEERLENYVENAAEYFEDSVGNSYNLKYETISSEEISSKDYKSLKSYLAYYDIDMDDYDFGKIMCIKMKLTAKKRNRDESEKLEVYLAKESGKWQLIYICEG